MCDANEVLSNHVGLENKETNKHGEAEIVFNFAMCKERWFEVSLPSCDLSKCLHTTIIFRKRKVPTDVNGSSNLLSITIAASLRKSTAGEGRFKPAPALQC